MSKSGLGDQIYRIKHKWGTKFINKFKEGLKSKLKITRGQNLQFFLFNIYNKIYILIMGSWIISMTKQIYTSKPVTQSVHE